MNVTSLLRRTIQIRPRDIATVCNARTQTWEQLVERVERLADGLRSRGLGRGERLATLVQNSGSLLRNALRDGVVRLHRRAAQHPLEPGRAGRSHVLANTGVERAKEIARELTGIDVIVCGHGTDEIKSPHFINDVYIVKAGYDGVAVGKLILSLDARNNIIDAQGTVIALEKTIEEDSGILALIDDYHKSLKEHADELFDFVPKTPASSGAYVGSEICAACHANQTQQWNTTDHTKAFDSLTIKKQDYNPECVSCHVTGFGYIGGFLRPDHTPEMAGVQCEMCHGAGAEHAANPQPGYGQISPLACIYCHTSDQSPNFDYATYYPRVAH